MQSFRDVIDRWPDAATMASDINVKPDLVRQWRSRDAIPATNWAAVLRAAKLRRFGITADLLVRLADRQAA